MPAFLQTISYFKTSWYSETSISLSHKNKPIKSYLRVERVLIRREHSINLHSISSRFLYPPSLYVSISLLHLFSVVHLSSLLFIYPFITYYSPLYIFITLHPYIFSSPSFSPPPLSLFTSSVVLICVYSTLRTLAYHISCVRHTLHSLFSLFNFLFSLPFSSYLVCSSLLRVLFSLFLSFSFPYLHFLTFFYTITSFSLLFSTHYPSLTLLYITSNLLLFLLRSPLLSYTCSLLYLFLYFLFPCSSIVPLSTLRSILLRSHTLPSLTLSLSASFCAFSSCMFSSALICSPLPTNLTCS